MPATLDQTGFAAAIQIAASIAALLCLIAAAIEDGWRYRISNVLVIGVVASFAAFAAGQGSWPYLGWSLAAGACMLALASVPFAFGVFGGGDTKLMAAMALWTQFAEMPRFVVVMSAFGGILGVIWIIRRLVKTSSAATPPAEPHLVQSQSIEPQSVESQSIELAAGSPAAPAPAAAEPSASAPATAAADNAERDPRDAPLSHLPYGIAIALSGIDFFLFGPATPLAGWLPF
jgi:Flp pilus assembly protein protease CpaA